MERYINILIIEDNTDNIESLKSILLRSGNNLIFCKNEAEAYATLRNITVGIILINLESVEIDSFKLLQELSESEFSRNAFKIVISNDSFTGSKLVRGLREGAVDYIETPFDHNLITAKIEVFKSLYFKNLRISQLLENIFPKNVLDDLETVGKFSPKRIENGVVLFTDFIDFTKYAKETKPIELLHKLEFHFNKFDEIIERYKLEKVKTVGDAYMALSGVTEDHKHPALRAVLAALEIRNFVTNQKLIAQATNDTYWDIRIGIHSGPLVAGIIGTKKISFDVWGDTVNIAARAEQNSTSNNITITDAIAQQIEPHLDLTYRGEIDIKHGGFVKMYFVNHIKRKYSLFNEGIFPNRNLRLKCDLPPMDFESARRHMINKLKSSLPFDLAYHNINHVLGVEKSAARICRLEGVNGTDLILLKTAVLFHDAGYIIQYKNNEDFGKKLARIELPKFGYSEEHIDIICNIIDKTKKDEKPETLLQMIMRDADHDYLGRADYHMIAKNLRAELESYGTVMEEIEWLDFQINYLENKHKYYTRTAQNIRGKRKIQRVKELKNKRELLISRKV